MIPLNSLVPSWIKANGPDVDVVISTRARLARSLENYPFPWKASDAHLFEVAKQVTGASLALKERLGGLSVLDIGNMSAQQRQYLLDAHLTTYAHANAGPHRYVVIEPSATLSVMVNEEDHIRMQAIMSGLVVEDAWRLVDWADDVYSSRLEFGFSDTYGYLTSDVSNVGTGLRVSALMHLSALSMLGRLKANLKAAYDLGVSVRGIFGEGSSSVGEIYQVSNELTLGVSEVEIVDRVKSLAEHLVREERLCRNELLDQKRDELIDNALHSLERLRGARAISSEQAMTLISPLRLAGAMGLMKDSDLTVYNTLMSGMRFVSDTYDASLLRAQTIKQALKSIDIKR